MKTLGLALSLLSRQFTSQFFSATERSYLSPQARFYSLSTTVDGASVRAVEKILGYKFKDETLLEEALTHPSCGSQSVNYQRLEFIGDAALGCAFSNYLYAAYPELGPGELTLLRMANVSTERLARVAVAHDFYKYLRHNVDGMDDKVKEFALAVQDEKETAIYGGAVKAPKVLADVVESVAAAMYVDCNYSIQNLWQGFRGLLEPIITYNDLQKHPQPVATLFELCQKEGKQVDIKRGRNGAKNISKVFVGGKLIVSSHVLHKESAKLFAAEDALQKIEQAAINDELTERYKGYKKSCEIDGAKQKLLELCGKNKWAKPCFRYALVSKETIR